MKCRLNKQNIGRCHDDATRQVSWTVKPGVTAQDQTPQNVSFPYCTYHAEWIVKAFQSEPRVSNIKVTNL